MTSNQHSYQGGCLCGQVRYLATGKPIGGGYCHCESCRRHTGAPVVAFIVFSATQVRWTASAPNHYQSSQQSQTSLFATIVGHH